MSEKKKRHETMAKIATTAITPLHSARTLTGLLKQSFVQPNQTDEEEDDDDDAHIRQATDLVSVNLPGVFTTICSTAMLTMDNWVVKHWKIEESSRQKYFLMFKKHESVKEMIMRVSNHPMDDNRRYMPLILMYDKLITRLKPKSGSEIGDYKELIKHISAFVNLYESSITAVEQEITKPETPRLKFVLDMFFSDVNIRDATIDILRQWDCRLVHLTGEFPEQNAEEDAALYSRRVIAFLLQYVKVYCMIFTVIMTAVIITRNPHSNQDGRDTETTRSDEQILLDRRFDSSMAKFLVIVLQACLLAGQDNQVYQQLAITNQEIFDHINFYMYDVIVMFMLPNRENKDIREKVFDKIWKLDDVMRNN